MATLFLKTDPLLYGDAFPAFDKPSVVGEMCVTKQRDVLMGRCQAKYLYEKAVGQQCNFDLNIGYDEYENKDVLVNEGLDKLLIWLLKSSEPGLAMNKVCHEADFVCWRGTLRRIACSPYENQEDWQLAAVQYKSVIFICEFPTNRKILQTNSMSSRDKMMSYWGFKFERYITADSLSSEPGGNEPVTSLEEFIVVVKSCLGGRKKGFNILYSGEVDCIDAEGEYVELKTQSKKLTYYFWREKAMKWWTQSFLMGIQNIIVGFRNEDGIVSRTERLGVQQLAKQARQWSANVTFNFLYALLSRVKELLEASPDLTYYVFEFDPSKKCITFQTSPSSDKFSFLPNWFLANFDKSELISGNPKGVFL